MTTETRQALAVLFRRFNEEAVPRNDLVKATSLELDWTKPSRAENLLDRGLNAGHLEDRGDEGLAAAFDPADVDVPFGFAPDAELFEPVETAEADGGADEVGAGDGNPTLDGLVDRVAAAGGDERRQAVAAVNATQEALGGLVTIEAAALLVAHERGLDVAEEAGDVLAGLRAGG